MIVLYGLPVSTYTAKLRLALHWRGIAYEEREPEGGYRSQAWRLKVPMGTIPAIDHNGFFLSESEAILEYLEDVFPQRRLLPEGAQERARVRMLARLHDLHLEPRVRALFPLIQQPEQRTQLPALLAALKDKLQRLGEVVQAGPYLAGAQPSLADCGFAVTLPLAQRLLNAMGEDLALPDALSPWTLALEQDEAAQAALAPWRLATESWLQAASLKGTRT
ncbi:MAG: glutathione S-transferase family protein [Ramlibacter sp.]|jgi:glutathione S-transferase|uniref:glutathione S-transferase family protein n=1 Tax=Ramlibacter sp. TaxID=1917967 RepID=UPI0026296508|nr:glutathione S-transferase family protein [Ramlibacter sp.]MDH4375555.1 glutathione S-transferase family protein [Ramlibacter sp.]